MYPVFANIVGRDVVVVGGGEIAQRKVLTLLDCKARVLVISPELTEKLCELRDKGLIEVSQRPYQTGDIRDAWLVIAATGSEQVNRQVFSEAEARRVFCNVVDEPELCSFQVPAVVRRGDLQIAVSTGGASPALARRIRMRLQEDYGQYYQTFLCALGELRRDCKEKYPDDQPRRAAILEGFIDSEALELLHRGRLDEFNQLLDNWIV